MIYFAVALQLLGGVGDIFLLYMLFRNSMVYRCRMKILNDPNRPVGECLERYHSLPYYSVMLWQIWRFKWPVGEEVEK